MRKIGTSCLDTEPEGLAQVPDEERRAAFYNIWTRKEAYVKARGDGIAAGLGTFAVSLGAEAVLLHSDEGRDEVEPWKLIALEPADGYVAALCGAGAGGLRKRLAFVRVGGEGEPIERDGGFKG